MANWLPHDGCEHCAYAERDKKGAVLSGRSLCRPDCWLCVCVRACVSIAYRIQRRLSDIKRHPRAATSAVKTQNFQPTMQQSTAASLSIATQSISQLNANRRSPLVFERFLMEIYDTPAKSCWWVSHFFHILKLMCRFQLCLDSAACFTIEVL